VLERPASPHAEALFEILADRSVPDDSLLPSTGVPLDVERALSPAFIQSAVYGTRCSTVVLWHRSGAVYFEERSFDAAGDNIGTVTETLHVPSSPAR
jgi:uncharacterized protein with NRDE domain